MKQRFALILSLLVCFSSLSMAMDEEKVFVLPIETEIDMQAFRHVRKGINEAIQDNASYILVNLNTFGGALDAADSIRTALRTSPIPTIAFVNPNAASAGALIALSCDSVWISPNGSMGSATVVNGEGTPMPEKYQQYMRAIMRSTAESHGKVDGVWRRNPDIADRMVRPDESISLTANQAVEEGYAEGIATSIHGVVEQLGIPNAQIVEYQPSLTDDILGFLSNAAVRAILIALILGAIYMEMHTPGLGFAAAAGIVATILFFLPMLVVGTIQPWVLLSFIGGVVLLALEVFVIPGFGICGIAGGLAIIVSLCGALVESNSINGLDSGGLMEALFTLIFGLIVAVGIAVWLTGKYGPKKLRRHTELMTELKNSDGFVGVDMNLKHYIEKTGIVVTDLRPAGKIEIEGETLPAVSTGEFITRGSEVKTLRYENAQLVVEKIRKE